ncbi:MAG: LysR family transcriptional regulator [Sandaracinaceae bacterium]
MKRAARLRSLWSWLPDFRAVAETQHLPTASEVLHVSASSLSRTIRLLEDDVGRPLFDRVGRQLVLNEAGHTLLAAVRDAMRRVDDALEQLGPGRLVGAVTISVAGPYAAIFVLPALERLAVEHEGLVPRLVALPDDVVPAALDRGQVDIALLEAPTASPSVALEPLVELRHGVFCAPDHPLAERPRPRADELAEFPFAVPTPLPGGRVPDGWPVERPRRIGVVVQEMQVAIDACASGGFLAVLPEPVGERAGLCPLQVRGIATSTLYLAHRTTLDPEGRIEAVLGALRAAR